MKYKWLPSEDFENSYHKYLYEYSRVAFGAYFVFLELMVFLWENSGLTKRGRGRIIYVESFSRRVESRLHVPVQDFLIGAFGLQGYEETNTDHANKTPSIANGKNASSDTCHWRTIEFTTL